MGGVRRSKVMAVAYRPEIPQGPVEEFDEPVRGLAAAVETLVDDQPLLVDLTAPWRYNSLWPSLVVSGT